MAAEEKTISINDIEFLNIHSEKIKAEKNKDLLIKKSNNTTNNNKREKLIEFIFKMNDDHDFLLDERWLYWYNQSLTIKNELQLLFKEETGETEDGIFRIKRMGGSKYSYDFSVYITNKSKTKKTFIPLEYKHQGTLNEIPQFYQKGNVSKPFFDKPYYDYYYDKGLPEINKLIGIDIDLKQKDKAIYSKLIGKTVYNEKDWEKIRQGTLTNCSPISNQLKALRETYERSKEGSPTYKKHTKIVKKTITDYFKEMKDNDGITLKLIDKIQQQVTMTQKPLDHNGVKKDKIYLLCKYINGKLVWKLDKFPSEVFNLIKDPSQVLIKNDRLLFPTEGSKYLSIRLRWQNVTGLCNPSWQFDIINPPKKTTATKKRVLESTNDKQNTTTKKLKIINTSSSDSPKQNTKKRSLKSMTNEERKELFKNI